MLSIILHMGGLQRIDLGVAVWNIALPFLRGHSATVPPNACQLCAYYTLFGGAIQRHRDNFTTEQMIARLEKNDNDVQPFHEWVKTLSGSHHGGDANSQVLGSYVLVFTYAGMDFKLSFPPQIDPSANRKEYKVHPLFTVRLSHGTLFIFSPDDDVYFCHEAAFPKDADGYRQGMKGMNHPANRIDTGKPESSLASPPCANRTLFSSHCFCKTTTTCEVFLGFV